jgi:hypothetical protein
VLTLGPGGDGRSGPGRGQYECQGGGTKEGSGVEGGSDEGTTQEKELHRPRLRRRPRRRPPPPHLASTSEAQKSHGERRDERDPLLQTETGTEFFFLELLYLKRIFKLTSAVMSNAGNFNTFSLYGYFSHPTKF